MRLRTFFVSLPLIAGMVFLGSASAKPNFSGTWKLDLSKSDRVGRMGPRGPADVVMVVEQKGDIISIKNTTKFADGRERTREMKYKTDGSESVNENWRGNKVKARAKWKGNKLVITSTMQFRNRRIDSETTWSLSKDGKTLTITNTLMGPRGRARTRRSVFVKTG